MVKLKSLNQNGVDEMQALASLIDRHGKEPGVHQTAIPILHFSKRMAPAGPLYHVQKLAFCMVVQGHKKIRIADEVVHYGPGSYLISTINVPITGFVEEATPEKPFLALVIALSLEQILKVIRAANLSQMAKSDDATRGLYVDQLTQPLEDAIVRLVRLLEVPADIEMMTPLLLQEIIYRLLQGEQGHVLAAVALAGSSANKVNAAINYLMDHYTQSFKIDELAQVVNMSSSTFHRYFKEVTTMSPLQFQKRLRLQKARELLFGAVGITEVAYQVGYESSSQFSREYSRMFGVSPREDVKQFKAGLRSNVILSQK